MRTFWACLAVVCLSATVLAEDGAVKHSYFVAGSLTGIVAEDGSVVWDAKRGGARDGYVLPNGNILICWGAEVVEFDGKTKERTFVFKKRKGVHELGTAQRLAGGNTLITELGEKPLLLEVDPAGKIVTEVPLQPETGKSKRDFHMQTRMARKLGSGNYLVPHLLAFAVKEYTPKGEIVKTFKTDLAELGGRKARNWPFTAIRLANGNTLVNLTNGNKTVEMDAEGKVVWKVSNADFPKLKPFADPCGAQRLPNGNTVIASYGARGKGQIKMFEVTRDKKIVWSQTTHKAHHFQVLTTNGKPVAGTPLK